MIVTPDPALVRKMANTAIGYVTHDYVRQRFAECALAEHGINEHDIPTWSAYYDAVIADMEAATAVGMWPDLGTPRTCRSARRSSDGARFGEVGD